jgi:hypothetical protein
MAAVEADAAFEFFTKGGHFSTLRFHHGIVSPGSDSLKSLTQLREIV